MSADKKRARLSLHLFGPPRVELDGAPVATDRRKALALLAYLVVNAASGTPAYSRESLAALFWPEYDASRALAYLRRTLWELNQALGEGWVRAERETVGLAPEADLWVDVVAFQASLARCRAAGAECDAREALGEAVALYGADFLSGFGLKDAPGFEEWALFQSEGLRRDLAEALEALVRAHLQAGRQEAEAAVPVARRWLALDPLNEAAHRSLMQVYEQAGQHHLALRQYDECARVLREELGVEPAAETQALYAAIKARQLAGAPGASAAPERPAPAHNLPGQLSKFIGRERELAQVCTLLAEARLVTLVGPGGIGKTRLALEAARGVAGQYAQGVWLVELAGLADAAQTLPTIATVLGIRETRERPLLAAVTHHLSQAPLMLVLDNCEHLVAECARLASELLQACPTLHILATSREALGVDGERAFPVPPLALPPEASGEGSAAESLGQYEAVQLFVERAAAALPGFALEDDSAAAVARICRDLDGIPLALELAAARVKVLSVEQIAARLGDRFRLLTAGSRTALPRQQTLRALIDWSYDLLPESERRLLGRLAVFAAGWTLEAAEAVTADADRAGLRPGDVLDVLAQLVHKSLVVVERPAGEVRYRLLETIRQYAREKLDAAGEHERARQRHLAYYTGLAEAVEPELRGGQQIAAFNRLEAEVDNLRAALEWSSGHDPGLGLRLAGALPQFWYIRGYWTEGREWLERCLAWPGAAQAPLALAKGLNGAAFLASMQEDAARARALYEQSLPLWRAAGQRKGEADTLRLLGSILGRQGDAAKCRAMLEQSLALSRADGDREGIAWTLYDLGGLAASQYDGDATRRYWEESLALHRALNHTTGIALVAQSLAELALNEGRWEEAQAISEEVLAIAQVVGDKQRISGALFILSELAQQHGEASRAMALLQDNLGLVRQLGNRLWVAWVIWRQGYLALRQGDLTTARARLRESLRLFQEQGQQEGIASALAVLALLHHTEGRSERAARLLGVAEAIYTALDVRINDYDRRYYDSQLDLIRQHLGEDAFAAHMAEGRALAVGQAIAEALND